MSTIGGTVYSTVYLGSAAYPDPLTIYGAVKPNQGGYSPGVLSAVGGVTLTNHGAVYGGSGSATYRGSVGVRFIQYGGIIVNAQGALIQGGAGFASTDANAVGFGGIGVEIDNNQSLSNAGTITGGASYRAAAAQYPLAGGDAILATFSTIENVGSPGYAATLTGGYGHGGAYGGKGVDLTGGSVTNGADGSISGGAALDQFGGIGARLSQEATLINQAGGIVQGGEGHFTSGYQGASLYGTGVFAISPAPDDQLNAPRTYTVTNYGVIHGGNNSSPGRVTGGYGVSLWDGASLDNHGTVTGGGGNAAGSDNHQTGSGTGGLGVELVLYGTLDSGDQTPSRLNNSGTVQGGEGSTQGGVGIDMQGGTVAINSGTITGGTADSGAGGIGAFLYGGTLTNSGLVQGGAGHNDYSGMGIDLESGSTLTNLALGTIKGADTASRYNSAGTGIEIDRGPSPSQSTVTNDGAISGGDTQAGSDSSGGVGVVIYDAKVDFTNAGTIKGGSALGVNPNTDSGLSGGLGVYLRGNGAALQNDGKIYGGNAAGDGSTGGRGAILASGTSLDNTGSITGGTATTTDPYGGTVGGVGVYLRGGALTTSGAITGGSGAQGTAAAVEFGYGASTLTVAAGASFGGAIAGFKTGDTIYIANLTKTDFYQDFNFTTDTLTTANYGTLHFNGLFIQGEFDPQNFTNTSGTGPASGLEITLKPEDIIDRYVTQTVDLGTSSYASPLLVTTTGTIKPGAGGGEALDGSTAGVTVYNQGNIDGGAASATVGAGAGIDFSASGSVLNLSNGRIRGGDGYYSASAGANLGHGADGVSLQGGTLINDCRVYGGTGYSDLHNPADAGGAGVYAVGGSVTNIGTALYNAAIYGGAGNGMAASGAALVMVGGTADNGAFGTLTGGFSGAAAVGAGAELSAGATLTNEVGGTINGGQHFNPTFVGALYPGGTGVAATDSTLTNHGTINGGISWEGGSTVGGTGVDLEAGSTASNDGTINGGMGGAVLDPSATGRGGAGVYVGTASQLTNSGSITGGLGSAQGGGRSYGGSGVAGGATAAIINAGTITGGPTDETPGFAAAYAGAGVALAGGTLTNSGTIRGATMVYPTPKAHAGDGADVTGGTVTNTAASGSALIAGGDGWNGTSAGIGLVLNDGTGTNGANGLIRGGAGFSNYPAIGGVGLELSNNATFTNAAGGEIDGGEGNSENGPATGAAAVSLQSGAALTNAHGGLIEGGTAVVTAGTANLGAGAIIGGANSTLTNSGQIRGGSDTSTFATGPSAGGAGAIVGIGGTLTNLTGGELDGGAAQPDNPAATAGAGVVLTGGTLTNAGSISGGAGNTTGADGVYLNGGTFTDSGSVSGGLGSAATGAAVQFGHAASTLVLQTGATFNGDIAGFRYGDTIDLANVTLTAGDFDRATDQLATGAAYGTLQISGYFIPGQMQFTGDGHDGTDITLLSESIISTAITHPIVIGASTYPSPLTITATGSVSAGLGSGLGPQSTEWAVYSDNAGDSLANAGSITGGHSAAGLTAYELNQYFPKPQAAGVYFEAGGSITNTGSISGGDLSLVGAFPGYASEGLRVGGVGVLLNGGTLTNAGTASGGYAKGPVNPFSPGLIRGGDGAYVTNGTVDNTAASGTARIVGGNGYYGARGGDGLVLNGGSGTNGVNGVIVGGTGYDGFPGLYSQTHYNRLEAGGAGVKLLAGATFTNQAGGQITGGGAYSYGQLIYSSAGVYLTGASQLTNQGAIKGGSSDGRGGDGLQIDNLSAVTNAGAITGGSGSSGGVGAELFGGTLTNSGSISGGTGSGGGGTGVYLDGGTLTDSGAIKGGAGGGGAGTAVQFGSGGTLVLQDGASITGAIGGFRYGDTVDITNLAPTTVGADYDAATHTINTGSDGTLQFSGAFVPGQFQFHDDGHGGTDVILLHESEIDTAINHAITLDTPNYLSPLLITSTGSVEAGKGVGLGPVSLEWAVYANTSAANLTNAGTIVGGNAFVTETAYAFNKYFPGPQAAGVYFQAGGSITNTGSIRGGYLALTGFGPGYPTGHEAGGVGVLLNGSTLNNAGTISGQYGIGLAQPGQSGVIRGGDGAYVTNGSVSNTATSGTASIIGGNGYAGARGGDGLVLNGGTGTNGANGLIVGGTGSDADFPVYIPDGETQSPHVYGRESGGSGVRLLAGATFTNQAGGQITGGAVAGYGARTYVDAGVYLTGSSQLTNVGAISGGKSDAVGGTGVQVDGMSAITNTGTIVGGSGAFGGTGVQLFGGTATNDGSITGGAAAGAGGIGVYLDGGTLTDAGFIGGGTGSSGTAAAIQFGGYGTLVVQAGASFNGVIAGFLSGDTVDVTNLNFTTVQGDYDPGTHTITTGVDGTLQFGGNSFVPGQFQFADDGSGGTRITLLPESQISTAVTQSITVGVAPGYRSRLTITASGSVEPGKLNALLAPAVTDNAPNAQLVNQGTIYGGYGKLSDDPFSYLHGGRAAAVYFLSGGSVTNSGRIVGGFYYASLGTTSSGGVGVSLSGGTLNNSGTVTGAYGVGVSQATGIHGGVGAYVTDGTVLNTATSGTAEIRGGYGYLGADAAVGLVLSGGSGTNGANGLIQGGSVANQSYETAAPGKTGIGVELLNGASFVNLADARILGGNNLTPANGSGATGVIVTAAAQLNNVGAIMGGSGSGGGEGVELDGSMLTNSGSIVGGAGSAAGGGEAVHGGGVLTNSGSIIGGSGATYGGAGIYFDGGTLTDSGLISGGMGSNGVAAAIEFGGNPSTLVLQAGASFAGDIAGFRVGDTIDVTNLGYATVQGEYDAGTHTIATGIDGTLQFTGTFVPGQFQFTDDGSGGTKITLLQESAITTAVTTPIVFGHDPGYVSPLTITATGSVTPASTTSGFFAPGVTNNAGDAQLINDGSITGSSGELFANVPPLFNPVRNSTGVYLTSGAVVTNAGSIAGGYYFAHGATGETSSGGVGVTLNGATLNNSGTVSGAYGIDATHVSGIHGGAGAYAPNGTVNNGLTSGPATIVGGAGYLGADAGDGLVLNGGSGTNGFYGLIAGGSVADADGLHAAPGRSGAGLNLSGGAIFTNQVGGEIEGGSNLAQGTGAGGAGVYLNGGTLIDSGSIVGGQDRYGDIAAAVQFGAAPGELVLAAGASLTGNITGFTAGDSVDLSNISLAQTEADFNSANHSLITGVDGAILFDGVFAPGQFQFADDGSGGTLITVLQETIISTPVNATVDVENANYYVTPTGSVQPPDNSGAPGAYVNGGTLTVAGTISGSHGAAGFANAITFGSAAGTLVVVPGAVFNGNAVGNGSNDTLKVAGSIDPTLAGFGTQFTGFSTLEFGSGAEWKVEATAASLTEPGFRITGFAPGDTLDVTDLPFVPGASASFDATSEQLTITDGGATLKLQFDSPFTGDIFILTQDGSGLDITVEAAAACYRRGTRIRSGDGEVPIETLRIGDRVMTESGILRPIRWIGRRGYSRGFALGNRDVLPIRIRAGALGSVAGDVRIPLRDLWVSPEHAMWIDGALIPARALLNGTTIVQETDCEVNYVHLELDSHDVIFAEGAPSESFVDDDSRGHFDNAPEYARLYPQAYRKPAQFCAPRVEEGVALEAVRRRINHWADGQRRSAGATIPAVRAVSNLAAGGS